MNNTPTTDDRRTFERNTARRVVLIINDQPFLASTWSPSGFSIDFPESGLKKGETISGDIDIFEVEEIGTFSATIVRISEAGEVAAKFDEISSHSYMNLCITLSVAEEDYE